MQPNRQTDRQTDRPTQTNVQLKKRLDILSATEAVDDSDAEDEAEVCGTRSRSSSRTSQTDVSTQTDSIGEQEQTARSAGEVKPQSKVVVKVFENSPKDMEVDDGKVQSGRYVYRGWSKSEPPITTKKMEPSADMLCGRPSSGRACTITAAPSGERVCIFYYSRRR